MFTQLKVPVLGLIENMSTHICSNCGHEEHIFGHGGVKAEAEKMGVPLLAEVPLHLDIRVASDGGAPIVVTKPDSPQAQAFRQVARDLVSRGVA
jgi:ATP-binding protein involved in chromosome partitioning